VPPRRTFRASRPASDAAFISSLEITVKLNTTKWLACALMAVQVLSGCATPLEYREDLYETFPDALQTCRHKASGRLAQRMNLPATHPHVADCLKRHGWQTDGSRIESSETGEPPASP
jgi:hypothetical protein